MGVPAVRPAPGTAPWYVHRLPRAAGKARPVAKEYKMGTWGLSGAVLGPEGRVLVPTFSTATSGKAVALPRLMSVLP